MSKRLLWEQLGGMARLAMILEAFEVLADNRVILQAGDNKTENYEVDMIQLAFLVYLLFQIQLRLIDCKNNELIKRKYVKAHSVKF